MDNFNSSAAQNLKTFARVLRIRVGCADDNLFDSSGDDGIRAGRRAAARATRFERDVKYRAARRVAVFLRVAERLDFRVRQACAPVPAVADDFSAFDQNRADHRIRRRCAEASPGEPERKAHELDVRHRRAS